MVPHWSQSDAFPLGIDQGFVYRFAVMKTESSKLHMIDKLDEGCVRRWRDAGC